MKKVVILGGGRLPFQPSGTIYKSLSNFDLAKEAILGCLRQTAIEPDKIDHVFMGNVIQEVTTNNVAREASLQAGVPKNVPATTISQACISSSQCVSLGSHSIKVGDANLVLAGGVETFSDKIFYLDNKDWSSLLWLFVHLSSLFSNYILFYQLDKKINLC